MIRVPKLRSISPLKKKEAYKLASKATPEEIRRVITLYWRNVKAKKGTKQSSKGLDSELLAYFQRNYNAIDHDVGWIMEYVVDNNIAGRWAATIPGIGKFIAGTLVAFTDIDKCGKNVSKLWRYCGLDPTRKEWHRANAHNLIHYGLVRFKEVNDDFLNYLVYNTKIKKGDLIRKAKLYGKGEVNGYTLKKAISARSHNPYMKVALYWAYRGWVFNKNDPNHFYGQLFTKRLNWEIQQNEDLEFTEVALKNYRFVIEVKGDIRTDDVLRLKEGYLPEHYLWVRAGRWTNKIFLSHFHQVMYYAKHGKMPDKPYILQHLTEDATEWKCPNWPFKVVKK